MALLGWIVLFTLLGGALSALAASLFLVAPESVRSRVLPHLVSFATGALLGAALLGLLPHAIEQVGISGTHHIGLTLLAGLLVFFVLEKMVLWRHCHQEVCEGHVPHVHATDAHRDAASASLILIGDGFHNVLDGVLIAAAFMTDVHLGVVTALAVIAHEIPQEVGDLAILLQLPLHRGGGPDPRPAPPRRRRLRRPPVRVHRARCGRHLRQPLAGSLTVPGEKKRGNSAPQHCRRTDRSG
jgi:zinc and cadmium transporter